MLKSGWSPDGCGQSLMLYVQSDGQAELPKGIQEQRTDCELRGGSTEKAYMWEKLPTARYIFKHCGFDLLYQFQFLHRGTIEQLENPLMYTSTYLNYTMYKSFGLCRANIC